MAVLMESAQHCPEKEWEITYLTSVFSLPNENMVWPNPKAR